MPKIRFAAAGALCLLIGSFATGVISDASAQATLSVRLPKAPAPARLISVFAVAAETRQVIASVAAPVLFSRVVLTVRAVPQVVFVHWLLSNGSRVTGQSPLLRPVDGERLTVDLSPPRVVAGMSPVMINAAYRRPGFVASMAQAGGGAIAIGIPSNGFTVEGIDLPGKSMARFVTTEIIQGAHCYNEDGGFVVVESDPDVLAILQAEIDFSNSPGADPSTRLTNRWIKPSRIVSGSWLSDGTNAIVTLRVVDAQGVVVLSKSATRPLDRLLDTTTEVASALAAAMPCTDRELPGWSLYFEVTITGEASEDRTDTNRTVDKVAWKIDHKYSGRIELRTPISKEMTDWRAEPRAVPIEVSIQDEIIRSTREGGEGDSWEAMTTTETWRGAGADTVNAGAFMFLTDPAKGTYNIDIPLKLESRWSKSSLLLAVERKQEVEHTKYGYGPGPTHYTKVLDNKKIGLGAIELPDVEGLFENATISHATELPLKISNDVLEFDSGAVRPSAPFPYSYFASLPKMQDNLRIRVYYKLSKRPASY